MKIIRIMGDRGIGKTTLLRAFQDTPALAGSFRNLSNCPHKNVLQELEKLKRNKYLETRVTVLIDDCPSDLEAALVKFDCDKAVAVIVSRAPAASMPTTQAVENAEREKFEAWYIADAARQGETGITLEDMARLREDNHYGGHRTMLNGKWEGWQARAALTRPLEVAAPVADYHQRWLDVLQDVLDAKEVMRAAGIGQCDFPTMFKEFAATRAPAASTPAEPVVVGDAAIASEKLLKALAELRLRWNEMKELGYKPGAGELHHDRLWGPTAMRTMVDHFQEIEALAASKAKPAAIAATQSGVKVGAA